MAIDTITPVADSILLTGDSVSFVVDDTYTTITIEVETSSGYEYAYDGALGGAQSGYTVSVVASGGRHTFTVTRSSGWDLSPFNFRVVENESGSSATTTIAYSLTSANTFPQGDNPYNGSSVGTLRLTDTSVLVAGDVGGIDFVGFTVASLGNGLVRITDSGGSGSGDVVGPGSATDNAIARFNLTTGKLIQNSSSLLSDLGELRLIGTEARMRMDELSFVPAGVAGTGQVWTKNTAPTTLWFTDDDSDDHQLGLGGDVVGPGSATDNHLVRFDGTTGKLVQDSSIWLGNNGSLVTATGASDSRLALYGRASAPAGAAGFGDIWVANSSPTSLRFTDSASSDHEVVLGSGITAQDAVYLTERADHVNTPGAGKAELWVESTSAQSVQFTDDTATDYDLLRTTSNTALGRLVYGSGAQGQVNTTNLITYETSTGLNLKGGNSLHIAEDSTPQATSAGYGRFWVKDDAPTSPMFTDDVSNDYQLAAISLVGSGAPGVSTGDGYPEGHTYVDTTSNLDYSLVDATPGANIWRTGSFFTMNFGGRYPLGVNGTWYGAHGSYGWIDTDSDTTTTFGTGATPTLVQSAIQATVPCDCIVRSVFYKYLVAATTLTGYGGIHRIQTVHATGGNATVTAVGSLADLGAPTAVQVWHSDDTGIDLALDAGDGLGCYLSPDTNTTAVVLSASVLLERI